MNEQTQSQIRSALKIISGILIAKSFGDEEVWEGLITAAVGLIAGVAALYASHKKHEE